MLYRRLGRCGEGTGAIRVWIVGIGGRMALWGMRADANAVAVGD